MKHGYIERGELETLDVGILHNFFSSRLGVRVISASKTERELSFTYALAARELEPEASPDDKVILQGMIDLAFKGTMTAG